MFMQHFLPSLFLVGTLGIYVPALIAQTPDPQMTIESVERIWDRAQHNAFTDLVRFNDRWYCTFREGSGHVPGTNGLIRIIASDDGQNWYSIARLSERGVDLRDPKISVTPEKRLMITMGGSYYQGRKLLKRISKVSFSDKKGESFSAPQDVVMDDRIKTNQDWLWRVTWNKEWGYGVVYQAIEDKWNIHLVYTSDGIEYTYLTRFSLDGKPNETTLRFLADGKTMVALVRREGEDQMGMVGQSTPPYRQWTWNKLDQRLGGPNFLLLRDGSLLSASRVYRQDKTYGTHLARFDLYGNFTPLMELPSGGDTSYAGMQLIGGHLYISYYSSHEDKTAIYFAKLWVDGLMK